MPKKGKAGAILLFLYVIPFVRNDIKKCPLSPQMHRTERSGGMENIDKIQLTQLDVENGHIMVVVEYTCLTNL